MKTLLNILCYTLGLMWLLLGLVGVYDPYIVAKNDIFKKGTFKIPEMN